MSRLDHTAWKVPSGEASVQSLVTRCVYEIATGAWAAGQKLPSVRQAEREWGIDRRAVMKAYQRLETLGLVQGVDRSGYYVVDATELGRVSRHRHELENLFERFAGEIDRETGLSVLGVFRYFAQYAEQMERLRPRCAFAECTMTQAQGHAREVHERLGVPCLALDTAQIEGRRNRIPAHVGTLLVTGFHYGELKGLHDEDGLHVVSVPIEVSPNLSRRLNEARGEVVIIEIDETEGRHIQRDVELLDDVRSTRLLVTGDCDRALEELLESGDALAMLSPRGWGAVDSKWHTHPGVGLIEFSIVEEAWPRIADAIGLPLGDVGSGA